MKQKPLALGLFKVEEPRDNSYRFQRPRGVLLRGAKKCLKVWSII
jgi:hypothetical protein